MTSTTGAPTVRSTTPQDEPALFDLWSAAFDAPVMAQMWALDGNRHNYTRVVVEPDGTLLASVVCVPRRLRNATGGVDSVAGVANVATAPSARGRGYARVLLADAIARAEADNADWALLFTGTPAVYSRSGWTSFAQRHRMGRLQAVAPSPIATTSARPVVRTSALTQWRDLAPLHAATIAHHPLATVRSDLDWKRTMLWHSGTTLLVAIRPAGIVGYLVVDTRPAEHAAVTELAAPDDADADALMSMATRLAVAAGHTTLLLRTPDSKQTALLAHRHLTGVSWLADTTGMSHPLRRPHHEVRDIVANPIAYHGTGDYL